MRVRRALMSVIAGIGILVTAASDGAQAQSRRMIVPDQAVRATINGREYRVEATIGYRMMGIVPVGHNLQPVLESRVRFQAVDGRTVGPFESTSVVFQGRNETVPMTLYRAPNPLAFVGPWVLELGGSAHGTLGTGSRVTADITVRQGRRTYRVRVPHITVRANIAP